MCQSALDIPGSFAPAVRCGLVGLVVMEDEWGAIRGCDAVYVALAEQLSEAPVTLDHQQRDRGAAVVPVRAL